MGGKQSTPSEITIYNEPQIRVNISFNDSHLTEEFPRRSKKKDFPPAFTQPGRSITKGTSDNARKTSAHLTRQRDTSEPMLPEELERIVRARVEEELNRIRELDEETQWRANEQLLQNRIIIEDSGANAVVTERDIEELTMRVERKYGNKISPELIEHQRAVISCYK
ncbi:4969_t:CDS:2 [Acaulospora colombiana]|uniref:4969_t:CDS:1 n=1 Tax=Acaulospora colombiana TaxID=27376 RepID=A0ACA9KNH1_9GLOM|nr:4969_t:CDS:2 [Acaulospora colombiana]